MNKLNINFLVGSKTYYMGDLVTDEFVKTHELQADAYVKVSDLAVEAEKKAK